MTANLAVTYARIRFYVPTVFMRSVNSDILLRSEEHPDTTQTLG